jgi:hypothetical protein
MFREFSYCLGKYLLFKDSGDSNIFHGSQWDLENRTVNLWVVAGFVLRFQFEFFIYNSFKLFVTGRGQCKRDK